MNGAHSFLIEPGRSQEWLRYSLQTRKWMTPGEVNATIRNVPAALPGFYLS